MTRDNFNFQDVFEVVKLIPKGRVTSYGAIAAYLGMKSGARMIGWAMHAAGPYPQVPAHRVVNSQGLLTGKIHFSPPSRMETLLQAEGIKIKNDKVQNFNQVFWNPSLELL